MMVLNLNLKASRHPVIERNLAAGRNIFQMIFFLIRHLNK